jgi:hypothetical protein
MRWIAVLVAALALLVLQRPAAAQQMGCFSDGDFVYLHVGSTYQYYLDRGEEPVDCTPDAVQLGLELTEEAVQTFCTGEDSALCQEKQQFAKLIRETYGELLLQAEPAGSGEQEVAEPAADAEPAKPEPEATEEAATQTAAVEPEVRLDSRGTIRWVQKSLKQLGYDPGAIDGAMGRRTAAAIKGYEEANGMTVTGKMSKALVASLREQVGQQ